MDPVNLFDFEAAAAERIDGPAWDYYRSGAGDESALVRNQAAWRDLVLHYRVLVDVAKRSTKTTVLGHELAAPLILAPTAFHGLAHPEAERATVRGAGEFGTIMTLSSLSNTAVEDVVEAATGPVWFQLYVYRDRGATQALVQRIQAAGAQALVLTVDAPRLGTRERDVRNRFSLPPGLRVENLHPDGYGGLPEDRRDSGLAAYFQDLIDPSLSWADLDWLRSICDLPILVKGVVRADDAQRAVDGGAAGVVVSNHGGRQLAASPATADALPRVADAIGDRATVLVDGGIRRGEHVLKALALGAQGVLLGRPILWGLGADGAAGVRSVLDLLRDELDLAMALCGCPDVGAITRDLVEGG